MREDVMDPNERLARELFGWETDSAWWHDTSGICQSVKGWHPDADDAQADMVVREVAKLGCHWSVRTFGKEGEVLHDVVLYKLRGAEKLYRETDITNRNEHIVLAACAALDAEKPKPHRCKDMRTDAEWRQTHPSDWWAYYSRDEFKTNGRFCYKCGHDLNKPDEGGSDD